MLFLITQTHTPENSPKNVGGSKTLYNPKAEGVKLRAIYGAFIVVCYEATIREIERRRPIV